MSESRLIAHIETYFISPYSTKKQAEEVRYEPKSKSLWIGKLHPRNSDTKLGRECGMPAKPESRQT